MDAIRSGWWKQSRLESNEDHAVEPIVDVDCLGQVGHISKVVGTEELLAETCSVPSAVKTLLGSLGREMGVQDRSWEGHSAGGSAEHVCEGVCHGRPEGSHLLWPGIMEHIVVSGASDSHFSDLSCEEEIVVLVGGHCVFHKGSWSSIEPLFLMSELFIFQEESGVMPLGNHDVCDGGLI